MKIEELAPVQVRVLTPDEVLDPDPDWDRQQFARPIPDLSGVLMSDFRWFDRNGKQYMFIGTPDGKIEKVPIGGNSTQVWGD